MLGAMKRQIGQIGHTQVQPGEMGVNKGGWPESGAATSSAWTSACFVVGVLGYPPLGKSWSRRRSSASSKASMSSRMRDTTQFDNAISQCTSTEVEASQCG